MEGYDGIFAHFLVEDLVGIVDVSDVSLVVVGTLSRVFRSSLDSMVVRACGCVDKGRKMKWVDSDRGRAKVISQSDDEDVPVDSEQGRAPWGYRQGDSPSRRRERTIYLK